MAAFREEELEKIGRAKLSEKGREKQNQTKERRKKERMYIVQEGRFHTNDFDDNPSLLTERGVYGKHQPPSIARPCVLFPVSSPRQAEVSGLNVE